MINTINKKLEEIGSKFRTEDGLSVSMYIGDMTFLTKKFGTPQDTLDFVSRMFPSKMAQDALRYGEFLTDNTCPNGDEGNIRIRTIRYDGKVYRHKMINGAVTSFEEIALHRW